jgi:hypothetical protein
VPNGGRGKRISDAALQQQLSNFGFPGNAAAGEHCHWLSVMARQVVEQGLPRGAGMCLSAAVGSGTHHARAVCRCVRAYQHLLQSEPLDARAPFGVGLQCPSAVHALTPPGGSAASLNDEPVRGVAALRFRRVVSEHVHFRSSSHRSGRPRQAGDGLEARPWPLLAAGRIDVWDVQSLESRLG